MIRLLLALGITGFASLFFLKSEEQPNPEKEALIQQAVYLAMTQAHLSPVEIDDTFSLGVYKEFINSLDGRKRFFTKQDLDEFELYKKELDDMLKSSDLTFFDAITEKIESKILSGKEWYKEILNSPFSFSDDVKIETDFEKIDFAADDEELKARWEQRLKFYTLQEVTDRLEAQKDLAQDSIKTFEEIEKESRKEIEDAYDRWYENYELVRRSDRFEQYINAITRQFDPHSQYFSPKAKQDFNMRIGGKLEGIGAQLTTDGEFTQVVSIVPGGPVWKDERIEVNDYILEVAQDGEETIDVVGMRLDDVISQIRGPKGTKVILTIQKKDGSSIKVDLVRDVINLEIARARAAVLEDETNGDKIGYIDLPMFYNSFDGPEGNSCTKDVAREIELLKEKNISGLILDLRGNLGGALVDAIDISGLFIEDGPIVQVKSRDRRPYIHKDNNSSVVYNGPLVVLVNSFSASASEIVAGALQDYGRAVIVGSQTFGKGSVQNFIDLDRAIRGNGELKPLGEVKLTIQKYYRVNGASTQLKGVFPDIILPDSYDLLPTGERENEGALAWSKINGLNYGQGVFSNNNIEQLKASSATRIAESDAFKMIQEHANWLKDNSENTRYPLDLSGYQSRIDELKSRNKSYEEILEVPLKNINVTPIPMNFESEISEEEKQARTESWTKSVQKDFYLSETISIVRDIINLKA